MIQYRRWLIALIACIGVVFSAACSDDDTQDGTNSNQSEDVGDDIDAGDEEDADTGEKDAEEEEDIVEAPDVDPVECAYPSEDPECEDGDWGPATFFTNFEIETDGEEDACCFDMCGGENGDGDGFIDNSIGEQVVGLIGAVDGIEDVNENLAASIQDGSLVYLLEALFWDHPEWDDDFELNLYRGGESDDSMEDNLGGRGSFFVTPANFNTAGDPRYGFDNVSVADGRLSADEGYITIDFPGLIDGVAAILADVRITGDVVESPEPDLTGGGGFGIENGKLGGVLLRDRLFTSINRIAWDCPCLGVEFEDPENPDPYTDGVFTYDESGDKWTCTVKSGAADACQGSGDPPECQVVGYEQLCQFLGIYSDDYDCEVDGEVGFSIGVHFDSVQTDITGIEEE